MDSEGRDSEESQHSAVRVDDLFEETLIDLKQVIDLKQEKSWYKTNFTRED